MFLYFCGKKYFLFHIQASWGTTSIFAKKKLLLSHSQSVLIICVILSLSILHGCFYCVFVIEVLLGLYRKTVSQECFGSILRNLFKTYVGNCLLVQQVCNNILLNICARTNPLYQKLKLLPKKWFILDHKPWKWWKYKPAK